MSRLLNKKKFNINAFDYLTKLEEDGIHIDMYVNSYDTAINPAYPKKSRRSLDKAFDKIVEELMEDLNLEIDDDY